MLLLKHENGLEISPELGRIYRNQEVHDPSDRNRAREMASVSDPIPVGILYRNPDMNCYEDDQVPEQMNTPETVMNYLDKEFDKFTIDPAGADA
jgi:2-oxoglutarate ferredoxin oxidoreductase subunit beta